MRVLSIRTDYASGRSVSAKPEAYTRRNQRAYANQHMSVLRAPNEDETATAINDKVARGIKGVVDVVVLPYAVAVIGESYWAALSGKNALEVEWSTTAPSREFDSEIDLEVYARKAENLSQPGTPLVETGDVDATFSGAAHSLQATYRSDYVYHAAMEPAAAVADVKDNGEAELWVGTQTQSISILGAAALLDVPPEKIKLHPMLMGGSFGFRVPFDEQKWAEDALLISRKIGKPVKVIWTREDDVKTGLYRPLAAQVMRAALAKDNSIIGWNHRVASASPLAFMNPIRWKSAKGKDIVGMNGSEIGYYGFANMRTEHLIMGRRARICALRGVAASYTAFAAESFIDEIASETSADPFALRMNEVPEIDVKMVQTDNAPSGAGELGVPMIAPAIANAVFDVVGVRVRHVPFLPERILNALS